MTRRSKRALVGGLRSRTARERTSVASRMPRKARKLAFCARLVQRQWNVSQGAYSKRYLDCQTGEKDVVCLRRGDRRRLAPSPSRLCDTDESGTSDLKDCCYYVDGNENW